jgi:thiol-disulfide isomerase/thioredoxin
MTSSAPQSSPSPSLSGILIPILVVIGVAWGALSFLKSKIPEKSHEGQAIDFKVGATLPDLKFEALDGSVHTLSQSKAKVVLINFWATWCEACMEEMPSLVRLHKEFSSQGFEIYGVNLDQKPAQAIPATEAEFGMKFQSFIDRDGALSDAFDVHAIPLTVVIDRSRKVLDSVAGDRDWMNRNFTSKLREWLSQADQAKR